MGCLKSLNNYKHCKYSNFYYNIMVSKGGLKVINWQIAQSHACFVPFPENKKSLSMPE